MDRYINNITQLEKHFINAQYNIIVHIKIINMITMIISQKHNINNNNIF